MDYVDVSLSDLSVMIGMPANRDIPPHTVMSLLATFSRCQRLSIPCELGMVSSGVIVNGRDEVLDMFLKSKANRLFWIDSDMTWTPEQFIRLLALSKLTPVVGATYPAKVDRPTFFVKFDEEVGMQPSELGLLDVQGLGLGFTVLQREVVEQVAAKAPRVLDEISGLEMASVFRWGIFQGKRRGEDMAFFSDIRDLGYKIYMDPTIDLGHIGTKMYTGSIRDALPSTRPTIN